MMYQCYSFITAQEFIKQTAYRTPREVRAGRPEGVASTCLGFPFLILFVSSPLEPSWFLNT